MVRIAVTGADGFLGRNVVVRASERAGVEIVPLTRKSAGHVLDEAVARSDFVFHFAGVNRTSDDDEYAFGNLALTERIIAAAETSGKSIPIAFSSSIQAERDNPYGQSKKAAEDALVAFNARTGSPVHIFRLPNVFGKWARPNYNSAVATFCHNIARGLPVTVHDGSAQIRLVYVDDVADAFLALLDRPARGNVFERIEPEYCVTVDELKLRIETLNEARATLTTERVGGGFERALHATFLSYLPPDKFAYAVPAYSDPRGRFAEVLKTADSGQFSFFTAYPGVTRGGHYHHSKTEKFLVVKGKARFNFRHIVTQERHTIMTDSDTLLVVETIPGWSHDITNIGEDEMIVLLWANEVFDRLRPDTVQAPV